MGASSCKTKSDVPDNTQKNPSIDAKHFENMHGLKMAKHTPAHKCPVPDIPFKFVQQGPENLTYRDAHRGCTGGDRGVVNRNGCFGLAAPTAARGCGASDVVKVRSEAKAPVTLHVYYVGNSDTIEVISEVAQDFLGQGGVFHGAVEIYGREWSFGGSLEGSGVFQVPPRACSMHRYRESIYMGDCNLTEQQVFKILRKMVQEWQGREYDLLKHNCCSFSKAFCLELGVGEIPYWVYELAETGSALSDDIAAAMQTLHKLEDGLLVEMEAMEEAISPTSSSASADESPPPLALEQEGTTFRA
jgi:hypothetical protein